MPKTVEGQAQSGFGKLESVAGDAIGDHDIQAHGAADRVQGKAKEVAGSAQEALADYADRARDAVSRVADQAKQTYGATIDRSRDLKDKIDPVIQEKPYVALLAAFGLGFVASRLLAPGGPKIIYVKPRD